MTQFWIFDTAIFPYFFPARFFCLYCFIDNAVPHNLEDLSYIECKCKKKIKDIFQVFMTGPEFAEHIYFICQYWQDFLFLEYFFINPSMLGK